MKIRLSFKTWDTKLNKRYVMKRLWLGKIWTPVVRVDLRQGEIKF